MDTDSCRDRPAERPGRRPQQRRSARRTRPSEEPPPGCASPDYADAFEVRRDPADLRSAEEWARDGFGRLPPATRRPLLLTHRWILGFALGPWDSPHHILGWRIVRSEPERLQLSAESRLLRGEMVWRLLDERLVMTTFLRYERRRRAAAVWAVIGNVHRVGAPYLLGLAARPPKVDNG